MDPKGAPVTRKQGLGIEYQLSDETRYALEQMRVAMKVDSHEEVVARAFREFVEAYGFTFPGTGIDRTTLENFGIQASGNVQTLDAARGKLKVFLPWPNEPDWFAKLQEVTSMYKTAQLLGASLTAAYQKYVTQ